MVLFVLSRISGISLYRIVVAVLPFIVPLLLVTVLLLLVPPLVTFLPKVVM
jgi:TRAP-type C4-dicarboxylate transport system permease large subunit